MGLMSIDGWLVNVLEKQVGAGELSWWKTRPDDAIQGIRREYQSDKRFSILHIHTLLDIIEVHKKADLLKETICQLIKVDKC